jgi:hypothetical protein
MEAPTLGRKSRAMAETHSSQGRYPPELRERAVRLVIETREREGSALGVVTRIAAAGDRAGIAAWLGAADHVSAEDSVPPRAVRCWHDRRMIASAVYWMVGGARGATRLASPPSLWPRQRSSVIASRILAASSRFMSAASEACRVPVGAAFGAEERAKRAQVAQSVAVLEAAEPEPAIPALQARSGVYSRSRSGGCVHSTRRAPSSGRSTRSRPQSRTCP